MTWLEWVIRVSGEKVQMVPILHSKNSNLLYQIQENAHFVDIFLLLRRGCMPRIPGVIPGGQPQESGGDSKAI